LLDGIVHLLVDIPIMGRIIPGSVKNDILAFKRRH
jgi:hypothetical protein